MNEENEIRLLLMRFNFYVRRINRRLHPEYRKKIEKELPDFTDKLINKEIEEKINNIEEIRAVVEKMENFYHNTKHVSSDALTLLHCIMIECAKQQMGITMVDQKADTKLSINPDLFNKKLDQKG